MRDDRRPRAPDRERTTPRTGRDERRRRTPPVFSVRDLWKVFGPKADRVPGDAELGALTPAELRERTGCTAAVRDVSFDVRKGEVFVVMGLSGSGKSTLVRCLTRLIEPTSGDARHRRRGRPAPWTRPGCANCAATAPPWSSSTSACCRTAPCSTTSPTAWRSRAWARPSAARKAAEVVAKVGLDGLEQRRPGQLSGGQQQRVGLARALAVDPEVLLFDEPFSALDPLIRRDMQEEVIRLHREEGRTMVFITHDLSEALRLGDRIALMRDGGIVQLGTPEEIVGSPADDYVRDFVRDVPREQVMTVRTRHAPGDGGEADARPGARPGRHGLRRHRGRRPHRRHRPRRGRRPLPGRRRPRLPAERRRGPRQDGRRGGGQSAAAEHAPRRAAVRDRPLRRAAQARPTCASDHPRAGRAHGHDAVAQRRPPSRRRPASCERLAASSKLLLAVAAAVLVAARQRPAGPAAAGRTR